MGPQPCGQPWSCAGRARTCVRQLPHRWKDQMQQRRPTVMYTRSAMIDITPRALIRSWLARWACCSSSGLWRTCCTARARCSLAQTKSTTPAGVLGGSRRGMAVVGLVPEECTASRSRRATASAKYDAAAARSHRLRSHRTTLAATALVVVLPVAPVLSVLPLDHLRPV